MTGPELPTGFAVSQSFFEVLARRGWSTSNRVTEDGQVRMTITLPDGHRGSIVLSQAIWDGVDWVHASIAFPDSMPSYEELTVLHRAVFGRRRYAFQVFAPVSQHVNLHAYALHLFGRADGLSPLPEFGRFGTI